MARTYALDKIMAEQRRKAAAAIEQHRQGEVLPVYDYGRSLLPATERDAIKAAIAQAGAEKPVRKTRAQRQAELLARQGKRS